MITLYHLNHSCTDVVPGSIFDLLPLNIAPGSEHAEAYEEWKTAFPEGLSVFGYRHMTPEQAFGRVPASKLNLEWQCELVRRKLFPRLRSRFQGFFALASLEEAIAFRDATRVETGTTGGIWEIEADRVHHRGDMRLLTPERCNERNLRAYWEGKPLDDGAPVWECMVLPPVKMVRCVLPAGESISA
jgi:hypothetical protein